MANTMFDAAKKSFLDGQINMLTNDLRIILVNNTLYVPNFATDTFLSSVPAGARVAVSPSLTGKTTTAGQFACDTVIYGSTGTPGSPIDALLLYQHTGVDATSRLIEWKDSFPGIPQVSNGGPASIVWSSFVFRAFGPC